MGIKNLVMLSGDKESITQSVAQTLNLDKAIGALLPEGKLQEVEKLKNNNTNTVAFIDDGINDAPVLVASDVSMAMGGWVVMSPLKPLMW